MTLPVIIWEKALLPITVQEGEKMLEEKVNAYSADFFNMMTNYNKEKREQFVLVVDTVLAQLAAQSPGLEWLAKQLPRAHSHPHREAAESKSEVHIECTLNLSEMETSNM
jgi:hypothetical protein